MYIYEEIEYVTVKSYQHHLTDVSFFTSARFPTNPSDYQFDGSLLRNFTYIKRISSLRDGNNITVRKRLSRDDLNQHRITDGLYAVIYVGFFYTYRLNVPADKTF